MPEFNASVDHQLSVEDATEKLKAFLDHVKQEYGEQVSKLDGTWDSNVLTFTLTTYGLDIEGVLTVGEDAFERWDSTAGLPTGWAPGAMFSQATVPEGTPSRCEGATRWTNAEGSVGGIAWVLDGEWPAGLWLGDDLSADVASGSACSLSMILR